MCLLPEEDHMVQQSVVAVGRRANERSSHDKLD